MSGEDDEFLTTAEVAGILRISKATVQRHIRAERIKAVRIGSVHRVTRAEVRRVKAEGL